MEFKKIETNLGSNRINKKKDPLLDRNTVRLKSSIELIDEKIEQMEMSKRVKSLKQSIEQETRRITGIRGRIEKLEEERKLERLVSGFGRTFFGYANRPGMRDEVGYLGQEISRRYEDIKAAEKNMREWKDELSKLNGG